MALAVSKAGHIPGPSLHPDDDPSDLLTRHGQAVSQTSSPATVETALDGDQAQRRRAKAGLAMPPASLAMPWAGRATWQASFAAQGPKQQTL